jgi:Cu/Ag efflux pump CusA
MNISELSLRRPVLAIVLNIVIIVFGLIGFNFLGIRDYPAIDPPNVSVRTNYSGANADIIETQITEPLEKSINGIAGIKNITSSSSQGSSNINVEFEVNIDLEAAANDVRDKVSQASRSLPDDLDSPPVVSKADASSDPIISMTVQSNTTLRSLVEIVAKSKRNIFPVLSDENALLGIISLENIREIMFNTEKYDSVFAHHLIQKPTVTADLYDDMSVIMEKFDKTGVWNIPVLDSGKYIGFISKSRIFSNYRDKLRGDE